MAEHPAEHHQAAAHDGIHKKLGPLEAWQWAAIGVLIGAVLYIRNRNASTASSAAAPTAAATDPNAGYNQGFTDGQAAGQGAGGTAGGDSTTPADGGGAPSSLEQELSDLGSIEALMSGLQSTQPSTAIGTQAPGGDKQLNKTLKAINKQLGELNKNRTHTHPGGNKNPGHTVTKHHNGKQTSSSTHHKAGQRSSHKTVASPSHQHHTSPTTKKQPMRHTRPRGK